MYYDIFTFYLGAWSGEYHVDLKKGKAGAYPAPGLVDATFFLDSEDFVKLFRGQLKVTRAHVNGKLKLKGHMARAMKLETLLELVLQELNKKSKL
jgi:putative sterol carrier protein